MATIITRHETIGPGQAPTTLEHGELAVNTADGKLWAGQSNNVPLLLSNRGGATVVEVEQPGHGFQTRQCVRFNSATGLYELAQADDPETTALGVVTDVRDSDVFTFAMSGKFEIPNHLLTPGEWYYLSDTTPGLLTTTEPNTISQPIVFVKDDDEIIVYPYRPTEKTTEQRIPDGTVDGQTLRWNGTIWENNSDLTVAASGNVGIGSVDPARGLNVDGAIQSKRIGQAQFFAYREAAIQASDGIGALYFRGQTPNGTAVNASNVEGRSDELWTDTSTPSYIRFSTTPSGSTTATEAMRIDSTGNVGIGSAAPVALLDLGGSTVSDRDVLKISATASNSAGEANIVFTNSVGTVRWAEIGVPQLANTLAFSTSEAERMRIDSTGNVGIGITNPSNALHVNKAGDEDTRIFLTSTAGTRGGFWSAPYAGNGYTMGFGASTNHPLAFITNNTERMRINSSGNVGIGKTAPTSRLDVVTGPNDGVRVSDGTVSCVFFTTLSDYATVGTTSNHAQTFWTNNVERARIDPAGNLLVGRTSSLLAAALSVESLNAAGAFYRATTGATSSVLAVHSDIGGAETRTGYAQADGTWNPASDVSLKENVRDIGYGLAQVLGLRPVEFSWKGAEGNQIGFIAQEAKGLVPESVTVAGDTGLHYMDKTKLIPVLVKAIQELSASVTELTTQVSDLSSRVEALEA